MSAEPQFDRAPHSAPEPASVGSGVAHAEAAQQSGPVVFLKRVQRSQGNRYVQRLVADFNRSQHRLVQRNCSCGTCEQCREAANEDSLPMPAEEESATVQAQARGDDVEPSETDGEIVPDDSVSHPLDEDTRGFMESRFGADFDEVRIHEDAKAAQAADAIGAEAFTTGRDIYFAAGRYAPDTPAGQHLLAHELAHTIQQSEGAAPTSVAAHARDGVVIGSADDPLEREADQAADRVADASASPGELSNDRSGTVRRFSLGDTAVGRAARFVGGEIRDAAGNVRDRAGEALETGAEFLLEQIERVAPGVVAFLRNAKNFIAEKVGAGFDALFGGLSGRVRRDGLAGAIDFLIGDLAGGALKTAGKFIAGTCAAWAEGANFVLDLAKKLGGEALKRIKDDAAAIGTFFSDLWTKYGAPGLKALKSFAASVWSGITRKFQEIWDRLEPIRKRVAKAWDYLVSSFMEGKATFDSWLDDLYEVAAEKWEKIKEEIKPYMGYVKALGVILLLISPMGPVVGAALVGYGLYAGIKYVWDNWGKRGAEKVRSFLVQNVLPGILNTVDELKAKLEAGRLWLSGLADSLVALGSAALDALASTKVFALARELINDLSAQFQKFAAKVKLKLGELSAQVTLFLESARRFVMPYLEFNRQLLLVMVFGPFAILDDGVWATINRIVRFGLTVPCVREMAQLAQIPALLAQADRFRMMMKAAWKVITNPDPIIQALHDALAPMVEAVPNVAAALLAGVIYPDEQTHREGVERYLLKAIEHLQANWWPELKKLGWNLIWPWDEVKEKMPSLIKHGAEAIEALFNLEISLAIDKFLKMMQDVNAVLGALWGWFALAAVLIGAVLGALGVEFSGGATIGAGAAAGWALAESVGLGLLAVAAGTELTIIAKSMFDLRFTNTTEKTEEAKLQADEGDYESIAGSTFSLAIMGAMVLLGALAGKLASSIWSWVKGAPPKGARAPTSPLDEPRGRVGEGARAGEPVEGGPPRERAADPDSTARPGDFTPEEIRAAESRLREKVQDPENIRDLTDAEGKYDAEVDLGDGRKMARNRETGTWCLLRNPRKCGLELGPDVKAATDKATGRGRGRKPKVDEGTDITDQVRDGDRTKPAGEEWRYTNNWEKWIEAGGTIKEHADGSITLTTKDGISCKYDPGGNPDYSPFLEHPTVKQVVIDEFTTRKVDFRKANREAGHPEWGDLSPDGYTWHHMPDLKTLQLVARWAHRLFRHAGGFSKRGK